MDRNWMSSVDRLSVEYRNGVSEFMESAKQYVDAEGRVRCPCMNCLNRKRKRLDEVFNHLYMPGISPTYRTWIYHGEQYNSEARFIDSGEGSSSYNQPAHEEITDALHDLQGPQADHPIAGDIPAFDGNDQNLFSQLLEDAQKIPFDGAGMSILNFVVKLLHIKVMNRLNNKSIDMMLQLLGQMLPAGSELPKSYYEAKKMLRDLGMGYESIDACKFDCVLFRAEYELLEYCPICGENRYKVRGLGKKVPQKILRYFPLTPRLQRLFMSRHTASDMRWHHEKRVGAEGILRHPADGTEWKEFDEMYPRFAEDPRNVRLGLASDGFNPYGNMYNSYSMWPVIIIPYNLPPWKCMKDPFMFMSLLIPGPRAPGKDINIFLKPLIEELQTLWNVGVQTFDSVSQQYFQMHAALLWTINDFPAYGSLSGWSTKGYMACPVCAEETPSQRLRNKIGYTGHRRFLELSHPWRRSKLFNGQPESRTMPSGLSGFDILCQHQRLMDTTPGKHPNNPDKRRKRKPEELNWSGKSIFFQLEYWGTLSLRHNLDVMHIEKNICESLVGTLFNIPGKTKDTENARLDLQDLRIRRELHLQSTPRGFIKPSANYVLNQSERKSFCDWMKMVKFPDGYASNISSCVREDTIIGLKSHDCHVLIELLLPVGIRPYLPSSICDAVLDLCGFFKQLCQRTLTTSVIDELERAVVIILCKLERVFPPAFFDVMVHLAVHLPSEARRGGPVHYRWMYPIERALGRYKQYVRNKARPEGSIAEAVIINEAITFSSMYLQNIETPFNRRQRNYDGAEVNEHEITVFRQSCRPFGSIGVKLLTVEEFQRAHWFILSNCDEVQPYLTQHITLLQSASDHDVDRRHKLDFPQWFQTTINNQVRGGQLDPSSSLLSLAYGPQKQAYEYSGCIVNGVRFHTEQRDISRITQNYGIVVPGEHADSVIDFYGVLQSVIELIFRPRRRTVLFECKWFDTNIRKRRIQIRNHITSVNVQRYWYKNDPYIFCTQARSVMYMPDPYLGNDWMVVEKLQHRGIWDTQEKDSVAVAEFEQVPDDEDTDQIFHLANIQQQNVGTEEIILTRESSENNEIIPHSQFNVAAEDEYEVEEEDEDEFESIQETTNSSDDDEVTYNSD